MGCICSKGIRANQFILKNRCGKSWPRRAQKISASPENDNVEISTAIAEAFAAAAHPGSSNAASASSTQALSWDRDEKASALSVEKYDASTRSLQRRPTIEFGGRSINSQTRAGRLSNVSNGERGAQVIAGWPSWLASVAGEAINGWVPRKADSFEKLEKIGQGTYSSVYKARDLETKKIVALKKVKFANMDPESVRFMAREIIILRRLNHPNVMKLEGIITSRMSASIYLIFEYMDHDLAGLASTHGVKFTESQIKCYMQQLLRGLEHCHGHGVLHRDIKGSNLLIDQNGNLKIGDFGLATYFRDQHNQQQQPLTSRVVTLWYRPPELLLGATEYGEAVDLWSSGCILAELFSGKPIMPGRTEVEQMHKIFKLCGSPSEEYWRKSKLPHATIFKPQNPYQRCVAQTFKDLPASALRLLDTLLAIEPENRATALSALSTEFFNNAPFPCDPTCLPKYPPSKEFDVNSREDEATRQKMDGVKARGCESLRHVSREHRTKQAPDGKSDLQGPIQKSNQGQSNKNPKEDSGSGSIAKNQKGQSEHKTKKLTELKAQAFDSLDQEACRVESSELNTLKGSNLINPHLPELCLASGNTNIDGSKSVGNHEQLQKDGEESSGKGCLTSVTNNDRVCHSGPLMPPGGNMDEMLREHEKQIQEAVRRARGERTRTRSNSGFNMLSESLNNELNDR